MDFIPIFVTDNQCLVAIKLLNDKHDVFRDLFENWQNIEYLSQFFNKNKQDLKGTYYQCSVEEAIIQTQKDAQELEDLLYRISQEDTLLLDEVFTPLHKIMRSPDLEMYKLYGVLEKTWLRIYAIKVDKNHYVVTGGAIKLTRAMQERVHTDTQLKRLERCRNYLISQGIIDKTSILGILKDN